MDIVQIISSLFSSTVNSVKNLFFSFKGKNIRAQASESIAYFPIIFSDKIDKDDIMTILKSIESEYAEYVKIAITKNNIVTYEELLIGGPNSLFKRLGIVQGAISTSSLNNMEQLAKDLQKTNLPFLAIEEKADFSFFSDFSNKDIIENFKESSFIPSHWNEIKNFAFLPYEKNFNYSSLDGTIVLKEGNESVEHANSKYAKIFNLEPTTLKVKVYTMMPSGEGGGKLANVEFIIGIKCVPHIIPSNDMIYHTGRALKNENFFMNLIKFTTGEKKFWRDWFFKVEDFKKDVVTSKNDKTARLWFSLKTFRSTKYLRKLLGKGNLVPVTTLLLHTDEVNEIRKQHGINLMEVQNTKKLMDTLSLFGLNVYDPINKLYHVYIEENKEWVAYPLEFLDEKSNDKNLSKQMLKIVANMRNLGGL